MGKRATNQANGPEDHEDQGVNDAAPEASEGGDAGADALAEGRMEIAFGGGADTPIERLPAMRVARRDFELKGKRLVLQREVKVDTRGMLAAAKITHVLLVVDGQVAGACELAAPLTLQPNEEAAFKRGTIVFGGVFG